MFDKLERKQRMLDELMKHLDSKEAERLQVSMPKGADMAGTGKVMFDQMKSPEFAGVSTGEINKVMDQGDEAPDMQVEIGVEGSPEEEAADNNESGVGKDDMWEGMDGDDIMSLMREYMKA